MDSSINNTSKLDDVLEQFSKLATIASSKKQDFYSNDDLAIIFNVSKPTLKRYRDEGMLGFSQVRDKCFYTSEDILKFLAKTHYKPFYWD